MRFEMKQKIRDSVAKSMSKIHLCISDKELAKKNYRDISKKTATAINKVKEPNNQVASLLSSPKGLKTFSRKNSLTFPKTVIHQLQPTSESLIPKTSIHLQEHHPKITHESRPLPWRAP